MTVPTSEVIDCPAISEVVADPPKANPCGRPFTSATATPDRDVLPVSVTIARSYTLSPAITVGPFNTPCPTSYQWTPSVEICLSTVIAGAGVAAVSVKVCSTVLNVMLPD